MKKKIVLEGGRGDGRKTGQQKVSRRTSGQGEDLFNRIEQIQGLPFLKFSRSILAGLHD